MGKVFITLLVLGIIGWVLLMFLSITMSLKKREDDSSSNSSSNEELCPCWESGLQRESDEIVLRWSDHNVGRNGHHPSLEVAVSISMRQLNKSVNSFGITSQEENNGSACGIIVSNERLSLDYRWVFEQGRSDLSPCFQDIRNEARSVGCNNRREFVGFVASLVQSLTYCIPPSTRRTPDGREVAICGLTVPIETLANKCGDCDSKSVLLASLLGNLPRQRCVLIIDKIGKHGYLGVQLSPVLGENYIMIHGEPFVLIETTNESDLGEIDDESMDELNARRPIVTLLE